MAKRLTAYERRKLLARVDEGARFGELGEEFGVRDRRTLERHLRLAEQESEAKLVRREILKDALQEHLDEVRELIRNWRDSIRLDEFAIGEDTLAGCRNVERELLFECLKKHLPFHTLWRDYEVWKRKHEGYIAQGKRLREKIFEEGRRELGLEVKDYSLLESCLAKDLDKTMLDPLGAVLLGQEPGPFHSKWKRSTSGKGEVNRLYMGLEEISALQIMGHSQGAYVEKYEKVFDVVVQSEAMTATKRLFTDLRELEGKIHRSLDDVLLRRDYVLYECWLCPGRAKLLR